MTNLEKNIQIALMLGAELQNWYPPNKDTGSTGDYLAFPPSLYEYLDEEGKRKQYKWYPDNRRYHGDSFLKFDSDANWQHEVIDWIEHNNPLINFYDVGDELGFENHGHNIGCIIKQPYFIKKRKEAIFEALYQFSQYLKDGKEDTRNI